jgi:hypothetical protein
MSGVRDQQVAILAHKVGTKTVHALPAGAAHGPPALPAVSLRDDMRAYLPGLLPRFIALFGEAERGGGYELVRPALGALEALGATLGDHLPLLLPALVRLIHPGARPCTAPLNTPGHAARVLPAPRSVPSSRSCLSRGQHIAPLAW